MNARMNKSRLVALATAAMLTAAHAGMAQGSPPSRLRQKGPTPKLGNPAAPLKMPTAEPGSPGVPGKPGVKPRRHYRYGYPVWRYDNYDRYRYPVYYDLDLGYWYGYDDWYHNRKTYRGPLLVEQVRKYDPGLINEKPAQERAVDEALDALRREDYRLAADIYARRQADQQRDEAKDPPEPGLADREQQRLLAVALVGAGRMDDALRHALDAYRHDASLRSRPLLGSSVIPSKAERVDLIRDAVTYAQRSDAPDEAWFLVAMLMEADDRPDDARRMLGRAEVRFETPPAVPPLPSPDHEREAEPEARDGAEAQAATESDADAPE